MSHHLGYAADGNVLVEHQDSECMAAGVESQLVTYAKHHSKGMHIKIDVFLLTQWKNRLAVVRGIVERKNLLGYRMEWHEELHACLLSFLADELPTLGVLTDMVRVQFLYIYIG